jgi:anti-sigma-K factor RskA
MTTMRNNNDDRLFWLSEYLDGSLDPAAAAELERELRQDPHLRAELETLRKVDRLVRDHAGPVPELDWDRFLWESRRRRDENERRRAAARFYRIYAPLTAAAAVAIVVTTTFIVRSRLEPTGPHRQVRDRPIIALVPPEPSEAGLFAEPASARSLVTVSRTPPAESVVVVGPPPPGRRLIIQADTARITVPETDVEETDVLF